MSGFESTNTCDGNIANQFNILNQARNEGNADLEASSKDCIQQKLQSDYQTMTQQELTSDPTRATRLRAQVESELQSSGGTLPPFAITESGDSISFNLVADKKNLDPSANQQGDAQPKAQSDVPVNAIPAEPALQFGPTLDVPKQLGDPGAQLQPADANAQPADAKPADANAPAQDKNAAATADGSAKPIDSTAKPVDAKAQSFDQALAKPADSATKPIDAAAAPQEAPPKKVVKHGMAPAPKGQRRLAGSDEATGAQFDAVLDRHGDGTFSNKYKDGSELLFDTAVPPRVAEIKNVNGDRTTLLYRGEGSEPSSFVVADKNGNIKQSGHKTGANKWSLELPQGDKLGLLQHSKIKEVFVTEDGQLAFKDNVGRTLEQHRGGNFVRRDIRGRVMMESTPAGRVSNYEYEGTSSKPKEFLVMDKDGRYIEHGVRVPGKGNNGWEVYREEPGRGLDVKNLKDPARAIQDPHERVTSISLNHRSGQRVLHHANGDDTWQPNDDRRVWRKNAGGSSTITGWADDGRLQIRHHQDAKGVKTRYEYDREGQPKYIREYQPNGEVNKLHRREGDLDWYENGKKTNIETQRLKDGSVRVNHLDNNSQLTHHSSGETLYESYDNTGRRRVHKTINTNGKETEFVYNSATGEPIRLKMTYPNGAKDVWTVQSPLATGSDNPVWRSTSGQEYRGSIHVEKDGSVRYIDTDGGRQWVDSVRGALLEVTPKPKFVR